MFQVEFWALKWKILICVCFNRIVRRYGIISLECLFYVYTILLLYCTCEYCLDIGKCEEKSGSLIKYGITG